jgi:hypothetical protein
VNVVSIINISTKSTARCLNSMMCLGR